MYMSIDKTDVRLLRARPRRKVFQPIQLRDSEGTRRGHLLDLSGSGALAYCTQPPEIGAAVVVTLGSVEHTASVVWRDGRRFGVAFVFRLSDREIERVIDQETVRRSVRVSR